MVKTRSILVLSFFSLFIPGICNGQITSWIKSYTGTIDKYPIVMHLHKAGHEYSGYYYYKSQQNPVGFSGEDSTEIGKIKLAVFISEEKKENFDLTLSGNSVAGQWNSDGKILAFSAKEDSTAPLFDYVFTRGALPLRPKIKGSPEASFEAMAVWPKGNSEQAIFLKKLISEEFGLKNSTEDIGKVFLSLKKSFFTDYLEEHKDVKDEEVKEAYSLSMDQNVNVEILYKSSKLLMLASHSYAYTGGAHGNYGTSYIPVNLINNKKFGINDIITKAGHAKLAKLLERSFRKQYEIKDTDPLTEGGLFENKIEPNDNFYVTAKGLWFCYNPYEIGPYVMGQIEIFIPLTELNTYLQPGFKKLIQ